MKVSLIFPSILLSVAALSLSSFVLAEGTGGGGGSDKKATNLDNKSKDKCNDGDSPQEDQEPGF